MFTIIQIIPKLHKGDRKKRGKGANYEFFSPVWKQHIKPTNPQQVHWNNMNLIENITLYTVLEQSHF